MSFAGSRFHVRWGWLAYPLAVVVIAIVFVIVTIIKSRHDEPWKASVVALMFHGFHDGPGGVYERVKNLDDPAEMVRDTRKWSVSLANVNGTKRFVWEGEAPEEKLSEGREGLGHGAVRFGGAAIQAYGQSGMS
jgi:hypothetical protein